MKIKKIIFNGMTLEDVEVTPAELKELLNISAEIDSESVPMSNSKFQQDMDTRNPIRERRLSLGLTQKQLAEKSGITIRGIQNYEDPSLGRRPKGKYLINLALALGTTPDVLINELINSPV